MSLRLSAKTTARENSLSKFGGQRTGDFQVRGGAVAAVPRRYCRCGSSSHAEIKEVGPERPKLRGGKHCGVAEVLSFATALSTHFFPRVLVSQKSVAQWICSDTVMRHANWLCPCVHR